MKTIEKITRWGMIFFLFFFAIGFVLVLLGCFNWPETIITQLGLGMLVIGVASGTVTMAAVIVGAVKLIKR